MQSSVTRPTMGKCKLVGETLCIFAFRKGVVEAIEHRTTKIHYYYRTQSHNRQPHVRGRVLTSSTVP